MEAFTTELVERSLVRLSRGESDALAEVLNCSRSRLTGIARRMLEGFPVVKRWEDAEDVFQEVSMKLMTTFEAEAPRDAKHYFSLAARIMRRHLIDLARRYRGPQNHAANHATRGLRSDGPAPQALEVGVNTHDPQQLARWTRFHEVVEELPSDLREVFDLMFYNGLTPGEVRRAIGRDPKTIRKRWLLARIAVQEKLDSELG